MVNLIEHGENYWAEASVHISRKHGTKGIKVCGDHAQMIPRHSLHLELRRQMLPDRSRIVG